MLNKKVIDQLFIMNIDMRDLSKVSTTTTATKTSSDIKRDYIPQLNRIYSRNFILI